MSATATFQRNEEATAMLLELAAVDVTPEIVADWTDEQVQQAEEWAGAVHFRTSDNAIRVPPMPVFLRQFDQARIQL